MSRRPSGVGLSGAPLSLRWFVPFHFETTAPFSRRRPSVPFHKPPSPSNPLRAAAPWLSPSLLRCSATPEALSGSWFRFGELTMASFHSAIARPPPLHQAPNRASSVAPHLVYPYQPHKPKLSASAAPLRSTAFYPPHTTSLWSPVFPPC